MIPKIIHYLFGLDGAFCGKPFEYFHYLNILSAKKVNPSYTINLYYYYRPDSIWFSKLETDEICNLIQLDSLDVFIDSKVIAYPEHLSDILRLLLINKYGGIYLDIDTICIKTFDDFLNKKFVMGIEGANTGANNSYTLIGLCNAVLISEINGEFTKIWLNDYKSNYKQDWNYNSVRRPLQLSEEYPSLIQIEPQHSFFKYSWDDGGKHAMFNQISDVSNCYSLHLWEHKNYITLKSYTSNYIETHTDTISTLYKLYVNL